jgi:hypothetical protein
LIINCYQPIVWLLLNKHGSCLLNQAAFFLFIMKIILPFLICFVCLSDLTCQINTFNKSYHFEYTNVVFREMILDSFIYTTGVFRDSQPPYNTGAIQCKFDLQGEPLVVSTYIDSNKSFDTSGDLIKTHDGKIVRVSEIIDFTDPDNYYKIFMICYNESGDTLFTRSYDSPYDYLFWVNDIVETPDHGFLILGKVKDQFEDDLQVYLLKTDSIGIKEWDIVYGDPEIDEYVSRILPMPDNEYLILGSRTNYNIFSNNFFRRIVLFKLDNENILSEYWESNSDSLISAGHLIMTADQGYLFTGGLGKEFPSNANQSTIRNKGYILQLNQNFEKQWEIIFQDSTYAVLIGLGKSIALADGSGYLACGTVPHNSPGDGGDINGWVVKYTASGDSLWSRYFHYWDTPYDEHYFYDMMQMPDGGILLCGQAYSGNAGPQQQLGWLVKLDEFGCLVPGCQLVATENIEGNPQGVALRLYPNPVSEVLNVYTWLPEIPRRAILRIVGSDGAVVRESAVTQRDLTTMIPVRDLPAGVYYVQLEADGMVVDVEEVVVVH